MIEILQTGQTTISRRKITGGKLLIKQLWDLKAIAHKITTYEEAINLPNVGYRIALKIGEIVLTNGLRRLGNNMSETHYQKLSIFVKIYDVGIIQVWKWVQWGNKTLEDLKARVHLSENQRLGIERYDDLLTRIP
jgi:DNA polymerase IV